MTETIAQVLPSLRAARLRAFAWRRALPVTGKVALAFGMAALTGMAAQVRIPLGFTPVPITGQVFAVLLAGVLCGRFYGGLSQAIYVGLGVCGLPWFAGLSGGVAAIAGPTGGYLIGFVVAAELIGHVSERWLEAREFLPQFGLMLAGVAVIYVCGLLQLMVWLGGDLHRAYFLGVVPFIRFDLAKALVAASVSTALLPKSDPDQADAS